MYLNTDIAPNFLDIQKLSKNFDSECKRFPNIQHELPYPRLRRSKNNDISKLKILNADISFKVSTLGVV